MITANAVNTPTYRRNPLLEDITALERTLQDASLLVKERRAIEETLANIRAYIHDLPNWWRRAREIGLDRTCKSLSDEKLAILHRYTPDTPEDVAEVEELQAQCLEPYLSDFPALSIAERDQRLVDLLHALHAAVLHETALRRHANEDSNGRVVRRLLVEEEDRGELLMKISESWMNRHFFPGERPGSSEDAPQEMALHVLSELASLLKDTPIASDARAIAGFSQGAFNKVLPHARDQVRTRIETELRRNQCRVDYRGAGVAAQTTPAHCLDEMIVPSARMEDPNTIVLMERFRAGLSEKDRKLVQLCLTEGRTQDEAAETLEMSQPQVSKRLKAIIWKFHQVLTPDRRPAAERT